MPTGPAPSKLQWHRWFAWRPVFVTDRVGRRRLVWFQGVDGDGLWASPAAWDHAGFIDGFRSSAPSRFLKIIYVLEIPRIANVAPANSTPKICVLRWANDQAQRCPLRGAKEAAK